MATTNTVAGLSGEILAENLKVALDIENLDNTADVDKPVSTATATALAAKQATLVSGTSLKTLNGENLLGPGNISILRDNGSAAPPSLSTISGPLKIFIGQRAVYSVTNFNVFSTYAVTASAGTIVISDSSIVFVAPSTAQAVTLTIHTDGNPSSFTVGVLITGITTPTALLPLNGSVSRGNGVRLSSSKFAWLGVRDTHASSDWQVSADSNFSTLKAALIEDVYAKDSVGFTNLDLGITYYWRVRYHGASNGVSAWSEPASFKIGDQVVTGSIGIAGDMGFGVGTCPNPSWLAELSLYEMEGTYDVYHKNYGNYQHTNGGICVFIPKFYYRFADSDSSYFVSHGLNTISIRDANTFGTEGFANQAGYALHRAFIDGGFEKPGFFVDKYIASKDGTASSKSVKNADGIILYQNSLENASINFDNCVGQLSDAIVIARARGPGWNTELIFQRDCLAKISLAHSQASNSVENCAWYDTSASMNSFPKGNNIFMSSVEDSSIRFTKGSWNSVYTVLTGSGVPFDKTTHNGQANGVADIAGVNVQVIIGLTTATDNYVNGSGHAFVLKKTSKHADITHNLSAFTDAYGTEKTLANTYDKVLAFFPWLGTRAYKTIGNGDYQVFSGDTSGINYLRSCCGVPLASGYSSVGTRPFGFDALYLGSGTSTVPLCGGSPGASGSIDHINYSASGIFARDWRSKADTWGYQYSFRCSAYGS
jgi:hypothetical protein